MALLRLGLFHLKPATSFTRNRVLFSSISSGVELANQLIHGNRFALSRAITMGLNMTFMFTFYVLLLYQFFILEFILCYCSGKFKERSSVRGRKNVNAYTGAADAKK